MNIWSVLNACMASIAIYVGLHHLLHYALVQKAKPSLFFALGSFSVGLYDISCMGLYNATSILQARPWQQLQSFSLAMLIFFLFNWAISISEKKKWLLDYGLSAYFLFHAFIAAVYPGQDLWSGDLSIKYVSLFGNFPITYYEHAGSHLTYIVQYAGLLTGVYTLYIFVRYMYPINKELSVPIIASVLVMTLAGINDLAVSNGWMSSIYITEYSFTILVLTLAYNITREHIRVENKLWVTVRERETLLKEVHHRVKSNLQTVSGLLSLQEAFTTDEQVLEVFRKNRNRIRAMALIHETLYQSDSMAEIDFGQFVRKISNSLLLSHGTDPDLVDLKLDVQNTNLVMDTAIPCGFIINELLSNSLKYAFPNARKGTVGIRFEGDPEKFTLTVRDNGVGMPKELDLGAPQSMGLQLVMNIGEQLGANITVSKKEGTAFIFSFREYREAGSVMY
jgi:two-component sensor histidine kinase